MCNRPDSAWRQLRSQLRERYPTYVLDLPGRGHASRTSADVTVKPVADEEFWFDIWRMGLKPVDVDFAEGDTVFIGFPIWWHEEPAIIRTFLDNYRGQLKGKVLYPFCTSYESPVSEADTTLRKGYPDLNWKNGMRLPASQEQIRE